MFHFHDKDEPEPKPKPEKEAINEKYMQHLHNELCEAYSCFVCLGFSVNTGDMIIAWSQSSGKDQMALMEAVRRWLSEQEEVSMSKRIFNYDNEEDKEDDTEDCGKRA